MTTPPNLPAQGSTSWYSYAQWEDNRQRNAYIDAKADYGAKGDGSTDDTTALQNAINAVPTGGRLFIPAGTYVISSALTVPTSMTIEGAGVAENHVFGADADQPTGNPPLLGTVIKQTTAATNGITISTSTISVSLRRFGVWFASGLASTGHGIQAKATTSTNVSITQFKWDDLAVYGHDGSHYGFSLTNAMHGTIWRPRSYGGGGILQECTHTALNTGNMVIVHPHVVVTASGGSAAAYGHLSTTSGGLNGLLNVIVYIRPQASCYTSGHAMYDDKLGAGIPDDIVLLSGSFESNTPVFNRGSGTDLVGSTLVNGLDRTTVGYGHGALGANPGSGGHTALGYNALAAVTSGDSCTAVGTNALQSITTSSQSTAVGWGALSSCNSLYNAAVGYNAGSAITTQWKNTAIGHGAGPTAGHNMTTALGKSANPNADGAVAIGIDSAGTSASTTTQDAFVLGTALHKVQVLNNTTGTGSAALGANCPAVTATAPYTWFRMLSGDGSTVFLPAWK